MELNADSANCYVNSWVFFHRSTEEIIALFISITFVLDAFKGIIKGKSCNNVFRCRSLLCFLVKGKYKAANMHDVCLFHVHSGASGGGGGGEACEIEAALCQQFTWMCRIPISSNFSSLRKN